MPKFMVARGTHIQDHPTEKLKDGRPADQVFKAGDVVESKIDLVALHGEKFQRVEGAEEETKEVLERRIRESQEKLAKMNAVSNSQAVADAAKAGFNSSQPPVKGDALDKMSEKELRELAKEEQVDIRAAKNRDDVIRLIRAAQAA